MVKYIIPFQEIDQSKAASVGGKGANLGELSKIKDLRVPEGFCITTNAYDEIIHGNEKLNALLDQLTTCRESDRNQISAQIRKVIEEITIPKDIEQNVMLHLEQLGEHNAYAVRSSATAEDLPTASFAGQQDSYLNIIGRESILRHVSKCWASLFTDRAIFYRQQNGFDHGKVQLAVVVQKMVFPSVSGIMFTADPVTSNRKVLSIDASFGLGEALVSGRVNADNYRVRNGEIIGKMIADKTLAVLATKDGGTEEQAIESSSQHKQALTDDQILRLEHIGRKIEKHFGAPQDIEWCLTDDEVYIVQSRPITTLFPIPEASDNENRVYVSVGHQQMMTDPLKPLGMSVRQLTNPRRMGEAGGRMFVDVTAGLSTPAGRENLLDIFGQADPLIRDALATIIERNDFIRSSPQEENQQHRIKTNKGMSPAEIQAQVGDDPTIVSKLILDSAASIEASRQNIKGKSGAALFDFILEDFQQWKKNSFSPQNLNAIMAAMHAAAWINEKMMEWLGEVNVADTLSQSVPNNVTSEMGLALMDVADVIRPYTEVIAYLQQTKDEDFLKVITKFNGGEKTRDAINGFLDKYGMRCVGEIDITRTRWSEKPLTLVPMILSNIKNLEPNSSRKKFEKGLQEALAKEQEILQRLKSLPDGERKAAETKQMIALVRNFAGYREYPKYAIVSHYFIYKQALLREAEQLVRANVIRDKEDIYYLTFEELHDVVRTQQLDYSVIIKRKEDYKLFDKLTPPRVITSDGEIITGKYKRENLSAHAIIGLPVSSGIAEGRARVIFNIEDADLEAGDILVTPFTDPSWTPLFVSIKGLITEVGGLMTHGAVIAREYGLPAIVGVENATKLIKDGQRIRLNGTEGQIEIL